MSGGEGGPATGLPIGLKVLKRQGDETIVATESGHSFRMPTSSLDAASDEFAFVPSMMSDDSLDDVRPAMARALLNEIIGAPTAAAAIHAETRDENR